MIRTSWHYKKILVACLAVAAVLVALYVFLNVGFGKHVFKNELTVTKQLTTILPTNGGFTFMAFLYSQFNNSSSYCGGTLIDNKHILTAAHCVVNASDVHVVLGTSKIGTYEEPSKIILSMKKSIIHEDYNSNGYDNDIALLQLDENVQLNEYINVVSLSTEKKMFTMEDAFSVLGWGVPNSPSELNDKLLIKNVNLADSEECFSFFKLEDFIVDYSKVICTLSEEGPCHSDSGGPLILGDTQIGVLSAGERNCTPNTPVRYMNVGYYRMWIQEHIGNKMTED